MSQTTRQRAKKKIKSPVPPPEEKVPSRRRRFLVQIGVEIEVDERLLASVLTDEWRQNFYCLTTPGDVAGHLAYNLIQDRRLSSLDGFADQPEGAARILDIDFDDSDTQELPRHELAGGTLQYRRSSRPEYNWMCTCGEHDGTWRATRRLAESAYQRHLVAEARASEATTTEVR